MKILLVKTLPFLKEIFFAKREEQILFKEIRFVCIKKYKNLTYQKNQY